MKVEETTYKGKPILKIPLDDVGMNYLFIGLKKCKAVVEYLDDIKKFIEKHDNPKEENVE